VQKNKYPDEKKSNLCKKKIEIFKKEKPSPNIAQVQISDKTSSHMCILYSIAEEERERERESSTKSGAWAC
jgi:hypothetical protein